METNNIINIPEGFEIDKEQSTERRIVLKKFEDKKVRTWDEYCEKMKGKDSYFSDINGNICTSQFSAAPIIEEFDNKEDVKALAAFSKLLKLRKDWIGMWKPDWMNKIQDKYTIVVESNKIVDGLNTNVSCSMSFPTYEMRDDFVDTFRDLLEIAKPLL